MKLSSSWTSLRCPETLIWIMTQSCCFMSIPHRPWENRTDLTSKHRFPEIHFPVRHTAPSKLQRILQLLSQIKFTSEASEKTWRTSHFRDAFFTFIISTKPADGTFHLGMCHGRLWSSFSFWIRGPRRSLFFYKIPRSWPSGVLYSDRADVSKYDESFHRCPLLCFVSVS